VFLSAKTWSLTGDAGFGKVLDSGCVRLVGIEAPPPPRPLASPTLGPEARGALPSFIPAAIRTWLEAGATSRAARGCFDFEALAPIWLKNIEGPGPVFRPLGESLPSGGPGPPSAGPPSLASCPTGSKPWQRASADSWSSSRTSRGRRLHRGPPWQRASADSWSSRASPGSASLNSWRFWSPGPPSAGSPRWPAGSTASPPRASRLEGGQRHRPPLRRPAAPGRLPDPGRARSVARAPRLARASRTDPPRGARARPLLPVPPRRHPRGRLRLDAVRPEEADPPGRRRVVRARPGQRAGDFLSQARRSLGPGRRRRPRDRLPGEGGRAGAEGGAYREAIDFQTEAPATAKLPVAVVNPRQVRDLAKPMGTLAKIDAIDANSPPWNPS